MLSIRRYRYLWTIILVCLTIGALRLSTLPLSADNASLPPRPTPSPLVTPATETPIPPTPLPSPTLTPMLLPAPQPLPIGHILLNVEGAGMGLWTEVQWQGIDGQWHPVEGWRGWLEGDRKRWAVFERNFGEGPFRWVIYTGQGGAALAASQSFNLPQAAG
ncbi:MAG: hypothetical protein KF893_03110, partial [Caldilineaceae bacterium]|nr:hypothetical protein [Caldilineaceae bacterium]